MISMFAKNIYYALLFCSRVLKTVDVGYFVMNFQSFTVNAFIVNLSIDNGVHKQGIRVFVEFVVVVFVLNKCIPLVHNVIPLLLSMQ